MRKPQQRLPFTSVFSSKRFVVSLCAAIAMVLGAMSVGAHSPVSESLVATSPQIANRDGTFVRDSNAQAQVQAEAPKPLARPYFTRQAPILVQQGDANTMPLTGTPMKDLEVTLKLQLYEAPITLPSQSVSIEAEATIPNPVSENTSAIESVFQGGESYTEEEILVPETIEKPVEDQTPVPEG
jgi:hypothetical protein